MYIQYDLISSNTHYDAFPIVYSVLDIAKILILAILTKSDTINKYAKKRSQSLLIDSENYMPCFDYEQNIRSSQSLNSFVYTPTVESQGSQMVIRIKPIAEIISNDDKNSTSELILSPDDEITDYKRSNTEAIFLNI